MPILRLKNTFNSYSGGVRKKIVANIVMMGFFTAITKMVSIEAMKKAIPESVPKIFVKLNLKAFDRGYEYCKKQSKENHK